MGSTGLFGTWEELYVSRQGSGVKENELSFWKFQIETEILWQLMQFWREERAALDRSWNREENSKHLLSNLNSTMPMPRPRARPRLTRMSTSSTSAFRQWNPRIYTFLVAGVVLLFVSISYLQMSLGGASSSHRPHHRSIKLDDPGMAVSPVLTFNPFITFILVVDSSNSFQLTLCSGVKKNNLAR